MAFIYGLGLRTRGSKFLKSQVCFAFTKGTELKSRLLNSNKERIQNKLAGSQKWNIFSV